MASPYREGAPAPRVWVYAPPPPERLMHRYALFAALLAAAGVAAARLLGGGLSELAVGLLAGAGSTPWVTRLSLLLGAGRWRASTERLPLAGATPAGELLALPGPDGAPSALVRGAEAPVGAPAGEVALVVRTRKASPLVLPLSAAPLVVAALGWYVLALNLLLVYALIVLPVGWIWAELARELGGFALARLGPDALVVERGAERTVVPRAEIHAVRWTGDGLVVRWAEADAWGDPRERELGLYAIGPGAVEARVLYAALGTARSDPGAGRSFPPVA